MPFIRSRVSRYTKKRYTSRKLGLSGLRYRSRYRRKLTMPYRRRYTRPRSFLRYKRK